MRLRQWQRWTAVVAMAMGLAVVSWASNVQPEDQMLGQAEVAKFFRTWLSYLTNGSAWGILGIAAGWVIRIPWQAALAGIGASQLALGMHYWLGEVTGTFVGLIHENLAWFSFALIVGAPLGLVGCLAWRRDAVGWLAALAPCVLMLGELVTGGWFQPYHPGTHYSAWYAGIATGIMLLVLGLGLAVWITKRRWPIRELWSGLNASPKQAQPQGD